MSTVAVNVLVAFVALVAATIYYGKTEFALQKIHEIVERKPGCNPIPSVGNVTLHYFAGRGRGEVIRLLMTTAGIPWTETKFNKDTWPEAKAKGVESGLYTYGQVPAISTSKGHKLVQTLAILQFLARSVGYECDCAHLHICHQISLGIEDITQKLSKVMYDSDFTTKKINEYLEITLPTWLAHFEKVAPSRDIRANELNFASERLTLVDFLVFNMIDTNYAFEEATRDARGKKIDVLENCPKLKQFYREFIDRPKLHAYMHGNERPPFKLPYSIIS